MAILKSRKFYVSIAGVIAVLLAHFLNIAETTTMEIAGIVIAYVLGQGLADIGKSK